MKTEENTHLKKAEDLTYDCVQCGYCLPACPTYLTMKTETQSPRGRINLVRMAAEGHITLEELSGPIDLCLGCRACEQVCPSNVQFGKMLELTKVAIQNYNKQSGFPFRRFYEDLVFKQIFTRKNVMNKLGSLLWIYQRLGVKKVVHMKPFIRLLPKKIELFDKSLTDAKPPFKRNEGRRYSSIGKRPTLKVAFFNGCVMEAVFHRINMLSIRLLQKVGCEVIVVDDQTCCGALQAHAGEEATAKRVAKRNIEAFEDGNFDYIVNNAGGCGAMLKEYDRLFADDPDWSERAVRFSKKTIDISVILDMLGLKPERTLSYRVTYQPSCHMTNVQKVTKQPKNLIRSIKGIEFIPLNNPNFCCGSAGIYNLTHFQESMEVLDVKMSDIKNTKVDMIITTNPGCLLQIKAGIVKEGLNERMKAVHLVELLAEACGINL
jgi:glycolate oxidase iron-sulfur subunit